MRILTACVLLFVALETARTSRPARRRAPSRACPQWGSAKRFGGVDNPNIDSAAYLRLASHAITHREPRRLSEDEFIRLARKPGVVILDARSPAKYECAARQGRDQPELCRHHGRQPGRAVAGQEHTILIYCNNNFRDAPDPMPVKLIAAALNLATYTSLYTYGYRNVYELGPNLSVRTTRIPFEGTWVESIRSPVN